MTQPTEQQPARDDLYDALDQSWYRWDPQSMAKGTGIIRLIDAHAAEVRTAVLREAADIAEARIAAISRPSAVRVNRERQAIADLFRRMAGDAR